MGKSQKQREQANHYRGHDPIRALRTQSGIFHSAWLKNGESLSILQRTGYTVFSLLFVGIGLYFSQSTVLSAREGDFTGLIFGMIFGACSLGFLIFGLLGLRNVLRFKRDAQTK